MKIIRKKSDHIVTYLFNDDDVATLTETGLVTKDFTAPDITSINSELITAVANPEKYAGGALSYNGTWIVVDQAAIDAAYALPSHLKAEKNRQINEWRDRANETSFTFLGHHIAADQMSKFQILATNGEILNLGTMPPDWVGGWKTMVNTVYVPILDVATWKQFHTALFNQGLTNFMHAQELKRQLDAATTVEQINAIVW